MWGFKKCRVHSVGLLFLCSEKHGNRNVVGFSWSEWERMGENVLTFILRAYCTRSADTDYADINSIQILHSQVGILGFPCNKCDQRIHFNCLYAKRADVTQSILSEPIQVTAKLVCLVLYISNNLSTSVPAEYYSTVSG